MYTISATKFVGYFFVDDAGLNQKGRLREIYQELV